MAVNSTRKNKQKTLYSRVAYSQNLWDYDSSKREIVNFYSVFGRSNPKIDYLLISMGLASHPILRTGYTRTPRFLLIFQSTAHCHSLVNSTLSTLYCHFLVIIVPFSLYHPSPPPNLFITKIFFEELVF